MNADDKIAQLKNMMDNILDKTVLKGLDQIKKINLRKIKNHLVKRGGNYVKKDIWVLDTVGTNLRDILACDLIDSERSFTNDIKEVYRTLGIEAARQAIYNEIIEVMLPGYIVKATSSPAAFQRYPSWFLLEAHVPTPCGGAYPIRGFYWRVVR